MPKEKEAPVITKDNIMKILEKYQGKAKEFLKDEGKFDKLVQDFEKKLKVIPKIGPYVSDIACMISLIRSYIIGEYKKVPIVSLMAMICGILYAVNPFDLIPDTIIGAGYIDDMLVLTTVLALFSEDIKDYKEWRQKNAIDNVNN